MNSPGLLKLGGTLRVLVNGQDIGNPPTKSCAILLIGLCVDIGEWKNRKDLAKKLFPDAQHNKRDDAFRQTLNRLKRWLGDDAIQIQRTEVRLTPGYWQTDSMTAGGYEAVLGELVEGIQHPWLTEVRKRLTHHSDYTFETPTKAFVQTILSVSNLDKEVARSILIGGNYIIYLSKREEALAILHATEPKSWQDSLSVEHTLLFSNILAQQGRLMESYQKAALAYKMAVKKRQKAHGLSAAIWATFMSLECAELDDAKRWIEIISIENVKQPRLPTVNAQLSYYWHLGEFEKAWECIELGRRVSSKAERRVALHFWVNTAVFASEQKRFEVAAEALENANRILVPSLDFWFIKTYWLAETRYLMNTGQTELATSKIIAYEQQCIENDSPLHGLYLAETRAEALSLSGQQKEAEKLWLECEKRRLEMGSKMSPHLEKVKSRIFQGD